LDEDGAIWAWGTMWTWASFTDPEAEPDFGPGRFVGHKIGLSNIVQISTSHRTVLALHKDGTLWAWGRNHFATAGTGEIDNPVTEPTLILIKEH
jgi:alpha-tubulin suppressor-like RCC1 family protein